jgi:predicted nucleic acid-binding Zn ribbon protein
MPLYEYVNKKTGKVCQLIQSVESRDEVEGYERITVPKSFALVGKVADPLSMKEKVFKGYYKKECKEGGQWKSSFTKEQIKKAWESED